MICVGAPYTHAASIGEEIGSIKTLVKGSLVSLDPENPKQVIAGSLSTADYLLGVVVDKNENAITFTNNGELTSVATEGEVLTYVSDVNGKVKKGDFVTASWLEGVGMKAQEGTKQKQLGIALQDFSDKAKLYGDVETPTGKKSVKIDVMAVRLFEKDELLALAQHSKGIEGILARVVGKNISVTRIILGSFIFALSIMIAAVFIYAAIKNSFISIGRNPLSSRSIYRSLLHVSVMSVIVIVTGATFSYVVMAY